MESLVCDRPRSLHERAKSRGGMAYGQTQVAFLSRPIHARHTESAREWLGDKVIVSRGGAYRNHAATNGNARKQRPFSTTGVFALMQADRFFPQTVPPIRSNQIAHALGYFGCSSAAGRRNMFLDDVLT